jgi:hypothetical protein
MSLSVAQKRLLVEVYVGHEKRGRLPMIADLLDDYQQQTIDALVVGGYLHTHPPGSGSMLAVTPVGRRYVEANTPADGPPDKPPGQSSDKPPAKPPGKPAKPKPTRASSRNAKTAKGKATKPKASRAKTAKPKPRR